MSQRLVESILPQKQIPPQDFLFHKIITPQQLRRTLSFTSDIVIYIIGRSGIDFIRQMDSKKPKEISIFFSNYYRIITGLNQMTPVKFHQNIQHIPIPLSNDLSLHFVLLMSHSLIKKKKNDQARLLLKKGWNYVDPQTCSVDSILLASTLSNLSMLYIQKKKHVKGLLASLKVIQIMQDWIKKIKQNQQYGLIRKSKRSKKLIQDAVILINAYLISKRHLIEIMKQNKKSYYRSLLEFIDYTGYRISLKYLGSQSYFTKKFKQHKLKGQIYLPVYKNKKQEKTSPNKLYQTEISQRLNTIIQILKTKKEPEIIYKYKQQSQSQESEQQVVQVKQQPPKILFNPLDILAKAFVQEVQLKGWNINVQLLKRSKDIDLYGDVQISCKKQGKRVHLVVNQLKLARILNQINFQDAKPYQYDIQQLTKKQFIDLCVMPFLDVKEQGNIQIHPKSVGLIQPFQYRFLDQDCLIFINHIRYKNFRIAISPKLEAYSLYLNVQLLPATIQKFFYSKQHVDNNIQKIWQTLTNLSKRKKFYPAMKSPPQKIFNITDEKQLMKIFMKILNQYEHFMSGQSYQTSLTQLMQGSSNFFKFLEVDQSQSKQQLGGRFYYIRYLKNLNSFDIYLQNSFKSHSIQGQSNAKGNAIYSHNAFYRDFGISLNLLTIDQSMSFCQILCQKYGLRTFDKVLSSKDQDLYVQNAITECPITSKSYKRKFLNYQNYKYPITASIVSVNNQRPVGVKIIGYQPETCTEQGFFFHAVPQQWQRPLVVQSTINQIPLGENMIKQTIGSQKGKNTDSTNYKSTNFPSGNYGYRQIATQRVKPTPMKQSNLSIDSIASEGIFKPYFQQFNYKHSYFLPEWMQKIGFQKLLQLVYIQNGDFYIEGYRNVFNRINKVLQQIV